MKARAFLNYCPQVYAHDLIFPHSVIIGPFLPTFFSCLLLSSHSSIFSSSVSPVLSSFFFDTSSTFPYPPSPLLPPSPPVFYLLPIPLHSFSLLLFQLSFFPPSISQFLSTFFIPQQLFPPVLSSLPFKSFLTPISASHAVLILV